MAPVFRFCLRGRQSSARCDSAHSSTRPLAHNPVRSSIRPPRVSEHVDDDCGAGNWRGENISHLVHGAERSINVHRACMISLGGSHFSRPRKGERGERRRSRFICQLLSCCYHKDNLRFNRSSQPMSLRLGAAVWSSVSDPETQRWT